MYNPSLRPLLVLVLLLSTSVLFFTSCPDESSDVGVVTMQFTATYDDAPLVAFANTYTYPDGSPLKVQLLNYYVSDIALIPADNSEDVSLSEVVLVDYGNMTSEDVAEIGLVEEAFDIPTGDYSSIRMTLGLTEALNATQPGDYIAGHPLTDNYWSPGRAYVFTKLEAVADLNGDGDFDDKLTYHIGANELATEVVISFQDAFTVAAQGENRLRFNVDVEEMLNRNGEYLDITDLANTTDHTVNEAIYNFLWENLLGTFGQR